MRHKHADLIHAWAEGAQIQSRADGGDWEDRDYPSWSPDWEYRIKPEVKPDFVHKTKIVIHERYAGAVRFDAGLANIQLTFDGETGNLKGAEVL